MKQVEKLKNCIPGILTKYESMFYAGESEYKIELVRNFKEAGFTIDCLESFYKDYFICLNSGFFRMVINDTLREVEIENNYDIIIWYELEYKDKKDLDSVLKKFEGHYKVLILIGHCKKENERDFLFEKFNIYYIDTPSNTIIAWKRNEVL